MANSITRVTLIDNTDLIRRATEDSIQKALTEVGNFVVTQAVIELENNLSDNNEDGELKSNGTLKESLTYTIKKHTVVIGSNLSYAPYVHEGTGQYAPNGGTGDKYWVFVTGELPTMTDKQRHKSKRYIFKRNFVKFVKTVFHVKSSGKRYTFDEAKKVVAILRSNGLEAHMTNGIKPNRFLRNAIMNNEDKIKNAVEWRLRNG